MAELARNKFPTSKRQVFVVFISQLTQAAIDVSKPFIAQIAEIPNTRLIVVGLKSDVSVAMLKQLSEYTLALDLSNVPSNIVQQFSNLYGC